MIVCTEQEQYTCYNMNKDNKMVQQYLDTIKSLEDSLIELHNKEANYLENKLDENSPSIQAHIQNKRQLNGKFSEYIDNVVINLKIYSVPYAIFLVGLDVIGKIHNYISTEVLFKYDPNLQQSQVFRETLTKIIETIDSVEPNFMPTFWPAYFKAVQVNDPNKKKEEKDKQGNEYKELRNILSIMIDTERESKKTNIVINQAHKSILDYEMRDKKSDEIYQQIAINWFKLRLNNMQSDKEYLCCKTIFRNGEFFECPKKIFFDFKSFTKIQQNIKIQDEQEDLSKTIAALMNQRGGVVFFGIQSEMGKPFTVLGFQMQEKNKKQFVKFVKSAVNEIYPKHKGFEQCSESASQYYSAAHQLNYYISIEFMNVVKRSTLESCKDPQKIYQKRYICKIVVKIGHPRYLYYVLKNEGNKEDRKREQVHFYTREESSNYKETVEKRYDRIYEKLIEYERLKTEGKAVNRPLIHDGCRYDMSLKQDMLKLDSEDDD